MKITGKLALSQLKINRSRTLWTLLAISLSEALLAAVCSFVASGNAMLLDLFGPGYGDYGERYVSLLMIPAIIFALLIIAMSVTVISNVFRISAQERISQFGVLKCTGATQKQITRTVMSEGLWLSAAAIPAGICAGLLLALGGVKIVNLFLDDLNDLARLMINDIDLTVHFVLSWQAILVSALLCLLTVMYSAWRPAHKAAKVPAIVCIHGETSQATGKAKHGDSRLVKRLFGFEGVLAQRNLKRNRKGFRATVISLSVGVILFVALGGLVGQSEGIQDYMKININETVISDYSSGYSEKTNKTTGRNEIKYLKPIDSSLCDKVAEKLSGYGDTEVFGMGTDLDTYYTEVQNSLINADVRSQLKSRKGQSEMSVEIITLDSKNYARICKTAGVPVGSAILLNRYSYNDFGHQKTVKTFTSPVSSLELKKADGTTKTVKIAGTLAASQLPAELIYPNTGVVRLVVPEAQVRGMSWYSTPEDKAAFTNYSNKLLAQTFNSKTGASYMEEGFSTRTYETNDYVKVMNLALSLVLIFMYGFVILLMLIGLTNVISTLSTNVMMRAREFAVLRSVGMTPESLRSMLNFESILCSLKALAIGIPVGLAITVAINLPIRSMFPVAYTLPWLSLILCVLVVFLITWGTVRYAVHKLDRQNIIETIRSE